ncbi:hypothetical protein BCR33DRAFT_26876 [Rhizoclosmatium globosum]|uniref:Uncharacterized protein n=1 Tax=Rhizoclosmatium globosum TaxID=329046 RepID=A0A1Y2AXK9_9FUNG|nr:hypothetical protein BCR33DRAFT_26876 [Rhizoclosmatium globosum]|eukprot:ORY27292.1 hypothetical protein BCR33DRAFT_26876 [Rhizoclosmatium globosum]
MSVPDLDANIRHILANQFEEKTKKAAVVCVEEASSGLTSEKADVLVELESSSEAVDIDAVNVPNMDVTLTEVQYSVSWSESCAESMYGTVVLDQDEDTM